MEPPRDTSRPANRTESKDGRVRALYTVPVLERSPYGNTDNVNLKGPEVSSIRTTQDRGKTPKDKGQEGPGNRLLSMLKKTLKGSDSEEVATAPEKPTLVPFGDVVGCLAIHIRNCRQFTTKINLRCYIDLFIRISINKVVKSTKICSLLSTNNEKNIAIKFDEVKYFSVQVPRRHDDERNNIYLELMHYDNIKKCPLLLGSVQIHLYEVIQKGCFTEEFQVLNKNIFICRLEVEFMFSYGNFGYGFSHQLKPFQKTTEPSMFMNITPPPERIDPVTNVIMPQPIEYPAFLSPDLNVTVGTQTVHSSNQPSVVKLEKLQQPPRERLEKMKKEYRNLNTWIEKAGYLESILTPKLGHKDFKETNVNEVLESSNNISEEELKSIETLDAFLIKEETKTTPNELLDKHNKRGLSIPTLNLLHQDNSAAVSPKSDESTRPPTDIPLTTIPRLEITEEDNIPPLYPRPSEVVPERKMKKLSFLKEEKLKDRHPGILKTESSSSEVAFSPKEYDLPNTGPAYIELKPNFQFQKFNKDCFDPFLRKINKKMSVRKRKDQDIYKCRNILSAEVIEHEDQDPPYPARAKTAVPTSKTWTCDPDSFAIKTSDTKNKLAHNPTINTMKPLETKNESAHEPTINTRKALDIKSKLARDSPIITIKPLDSKNKLKENLPHGSLPCFKRDSSVTGNTNTLCLSKSLNLTSHIENLKQSMILKSILSKNLQDLSDKLFSKEVGMNTEARKKNSSAPLSIRDKPSSSMEDKVLGKFQDLNGWFSEKDILNSKALLSQIIKNIPADSLSEGRPGRSLEVKEHVSEKHLEADKIDFPMKKKSSFKKKHLISEVSSPRSDLSGSVHDYAIKQIFTAPNFSRLEMGVKESGEIQMNLQDQLLTPWERSLSSCILVPYENFDDEIELPQAKSVVSQIIQAFPLDTLLGSGIIKVIELDKEHQGSSMLSTKIAFPEENLKDSTKDYSEIKSKIELISEQNMPVISKGNISSVSGVKLLEESQNTLPQDSRYHSTSDKETDLPSHGQWFDREENDLSSTLENLAKSLIGKLSESDEIMLKSFLKNIFKAFFKYQSERRKQPEKELESLIQHSFPNDTEHLKEIQGSFDKTDKLERKPILSPKLRVFLEELSESEVKNLKSELSKQIQHYLVERLSESGHITREDLPKIYQNLYLMNEKAELKGQNVFQEKYSETVKEIMSFVNDSNHNFIDKHLEIKLRSFLNEILQNYFLKNLSESSLFRETESESIHSNISSLRTKCSSVSFHELGQDISKGSFGRRLEISMKYPLTKPLQNYLIALSENEVLNLKDNLSKCLQSLLIEKLSKSGLMTERQLEGIKQCVNSLHSSSTPLKYVKTDLPFRDENHFIEEHSGKQNKYPKIAQKTTLQKGPENKLRETELIREEEKECFSSYNLKENSLIIKEQKSYYPKEEVKTLSFTEVQPLSNKNTQAIPLNKSSERRTDILLKKQRKEHGFTRLPQAENSIGKTEIQDSCNWGSKSKASFERTLKMTPLEKKDHINICKLTGQEKPEAVLSSYLGIPNCKMPREDEPCLNRLTFPSWKTNTLTHFNSETGEKSKLEDQYCQRWKGNNNNNKKHLVTFAQYRKEIQTHDIKADEIYNEKHAKFPELQLFKYKIVEDEKNSKPSLLPEVLKREYLKPKVRKERDYVAKPKKSFNKLVRILPTTLPATKIHLRKSVPKTLLHWTARKTIHDCSDKFEDLNVTSFNHLKKVKSRTRLLGKSPDDSRNHTKRSARPYTAPEVKKRQENCTGKFSSPRMVSAGLLHINDTTPDYEMRKMQPKKRLKQDIETCWLICDIIQMLNRSH
ncbi:C2 calcium-dependent domain-containing protein 6 [Lemur catta]|uniref:C2 calcium-dependent domain-containing protein 6 n=1 Tax=Lemur catta TaxID=9447 RepID=UPI001E26E04C|nr:C2 calcium-dependent domain-containing protein 6 [Lemur catta]